MCNFLDEYPGAIFIKCVNLPPFHWNNISDIPTVARSDVEMTGRIWFIHTTFVDDKNWKIEYIVIM